MNRDAQRQLTTILATIGTIAINALANALPINGLTTGEISDRFKVYFVPAGYVFAIWGLIYLGWIAFTIYQALPSQRENPRLRRLGHLFALAGIANSAWLLLWHYEQFLLTVPVMLILLVLLIVMYQRLQIGKVEVPPIERWAVDVPFSIYLGWITVATIANITSVLDYVGWDGWGIAPETWMLIMLAVALVIALLMMLTRRDVAYLLVLVWAFAGIAIKHAAVPTVMVGAWGATALVVLMVVGAILLHRQRISVISDPSQIFRS